VRDDPHPQTKTKQLIFFPRQQSHFVGLDIVPLQPDLKRVGSSNLAARISWVQSNFL
jgi:hypothetical protein